MATSMKILNEFIKTIDENTTSLYVFDFDDTLVKTDARVRVNTSTGDTISLSTKQFAVYERQDGDVFDYSEFGMLINPKPVKWMVQILIAALAKLGTTSVAIVSARGNVEPIKEFVESIGISHIEIIALGDADPQKKADWIDTRIRSQKPQRIEFFDDSPKNVKIVASLASFHPDVNIMTYHVKHRQIAASLKR